MNIYLYLVQQTAVVLIVNNQLANPYLMNQKGVELLLAARWWPQLPIS